MAKTFFLTVSKVATCAMAMLALIAIPAAVTLADEHSFIPPNAGHTAAWYDPQRDGEGWILEVLDEHSAILYWYTYDEQGGQRWLVADGQVETTETGPVIVFPELISARGGQLGVEFDPDNIEYQIAGQARMAFYDCDHGEFEFDAFGQTASLSVQRLSRTMAGSCAPLHGVPGDAVDERAGQSGSWMSRQGEGMSLMWLADERAILTWFSYDANGEPKWLTGIGSTEGETLVFPQLQTTSGARFADDFDSDDVIRSSWGSLSLDLSCGGGSAHFIRSGEQEQEFALQRLTIPARLRCPWQAPALSDLYQLQWQTLDWDEELLDLNVRIQSIADDHTVAALGRDTLTDFDSLLLLPGGSAEWEVHSSELTIDTAIFSRDTRQVFATPMHPSTITPPPATPIRPVSWQPETGWQELSGLVREESFVVGASQDRSQLVGYGYNLDEPETGSELWVWNAQGGQQIIPGHRTEHGDAFALTASNDGQTVVGELHQNHSFTRSDLFGFRYVAGDGIKRLYDPNGEPLGRATHCDSQCRLIFGSNIVTGFMGWVPERRESWFWSADGRFGYLGSLPGYGVHADQDYPLLPLAVSADGSLVIGRYGSSHFNYQGFVWTPLTGATPIREIAEALGVWEDGKPWQTIVPVAMTSSGDAILIRGTQDADSGNASVAAVLHLMPY